jgi:hypothetical protein
VGKEGAVTFMIFERQQRNGRAVLCPAKESFRLAGYNLMHAAWTSRGSPIKVGWHVNADELIRLHYSGAHDSRSRRFIIDFDPNATRRIGLVELLDVYAFTWGDGSGGPEWTPLMLRMRDLFYQEYDPQIDPARKAEIIACIDEPDSSTADFVEFLYLNGPRYGWNWGRNGMTNAAFLNGLARDYFRQFF